MAHSTWPSFATRFPIVSGRIPNGSRNASKPWPAIKAMTAYAEICGWALAHAHARSGDAVAIAAYLGTRDTFDRALAEFSEAYADQNERDYAAFGAAVESGRLTAETG